MKRLALAIAFLVSGIAAALAQANVQIIGPVTPGNLPAFSSPTIIKDSGFAGGVFTQAPGFTVLCNPTGSQAAVQACGAPTLGQLNLVVSSGSLTQGFVESQTVAGTTSATCVLGLSFQQPCVNLFQITADNANAASPSLDLDGWQFNHTFGGSTLQGARQSLDVIANFTAPSSASNTNRNYVAGVFEMNAVSGDGGTNTGLGAQGSFFGANAVVRATAAAPNLRNLTGIEIDVVNSGTTLSRFGLALASWPSAQSANSTNDAAINIYGVAGTNAVSWHNGIEFSNTGGFAPVDSTGCLICTDLTNNTVAKGIDLSAYNFSSVAFKSAQFQVDGTGNLQASSVTVNDTPQAWQFVADSAVTIANGANQALAAGSGSVIVHDVNDGAIAQYLCSAGNCTLGTSNGTVWVASTTTPAAGKMSVAFNGTVYAIYNNAGGSRSVSGALIQTRSIP